ncbi:MAG: hypothetical protein ACKVQS_07055 [Fimbriimonadaceae bacterium]
MSREIELVHALADGELNAADEAEARKLISENAELSAEYEWARSIKTALVTHCKPISNDEAWQRCIGRLDELDKVRGTESFVGKWAWVFCGALLLMIFAGGIVSRTVGSRTVSNTQIAGLLDPISSGTAAKQMPDVQAVNNVDLTKFQRTSAVGGYLENNRAFVKYGLRDQVGLAGLALAIIQGADRIEGLDQSTTNPLIKSGKLNGVNSVTWSVQGNTCVLFGERPTDELVSLAEVMMH